MDLTSFTRHAGGEGDLVALDPEHPGFRDSIYMARRNAIARIALDYSSGSPIPTAPYTEEEHGVWRLIQDKLSPLHQAEAAREILELKGALPMDLQEIPQLETLNRQLERAAGFRMEPVAGLVSGRTFMRYLGQRVFLSTQYIRHHSKPLYTPEPDVVHELIGHAATLVHPGIAEVNRLLGQAANVANEAEMDRVGRVYWWTMEFGVVEEATVPKAFGAGLLSSCGELDHFAERADLQPWDLAVMAETGFDPTMMQPQLFVAPSFTRMLVDVATWVRNGNWRD
jgi:phenylalanine-4-hydroxylase